MPLITNLDCSVSRGVDGFEDGLGDALGDVFGDGEGDGFGDGAGLEVGDTDAIGTGDTG
jgi:hypothetical protein